MKAFAALVVAAVLGGGALLATGTAPMQHAP